MSIQPHGKGCFIFFQFVIQIFVVEANLFPTKKSNIEKTNGHSVGTLLPRPNFRYPNCLLKLGERLPELEGFFCFKMLQVKDLEM